MLQLIIMLYLMDYILPVTGILVILIGLIALKKGLVAAILLPIKVTGLLLGGYAGFGGDSPNKSLKEVKTIWKDKRAKKDQSSVPGIITILVGLGLVFFYFLV